MAWIIGYRYTFEDKTGYTYIFDRPPSQKDILSRHETDAKGKIGTRLMGIYNPKGKRIPFKILSKE